MSATAVLAILGTIGSFVDNSLIKRLLCNLAKRTTNRLDDLVVGLLYDEATGATSPKVTEERLDTVQRKYEELTPEQQAKVKEPTPGLQDPEARRSFNPNDPFGLEAGIGEG